jgi:trehalose 6-phosphate phosphatase
MTGNALPRARSEWAFFFDIDGTLIEIADTPNGVLVDRGLQQLIVDLHTRTDGAVALISGRSIIDIDRLFPDVLLPAAGQHGVERRDAGGAVSYHAFPSQRLEWAHRQLTRVVEERPGLLLEHKGLSLALHYRRAPHLAGYAHRIAQAMLPRLGARYCLQAGKSVVELKPAGKDKGIAIQEFMNEDPFRGRTPVFVGDDSTDEFGFTMVNRLQGHSVKVGTGPTVATFRLPDVKRVRAWLERGLAPGAVA